MISVITCTFNSIRTIADTVHSVAGQIGADVEHLFVDGGSTDGTLEYLRQLPGHPVILEGIGGGIARAMNAGAAHARGEILCHLHSDDYFLHPRVLSRVAAAFRERGCEWLFGRVLFEREGGLFPEPFIPPPYTWKKLLAGNFVPHPASFYRASAFAALGGFRTDLKYAMDYDFFLRLGARAEPEVWREALAVFRVHDGSTTHANRLASFEEDHRVRLSHAPGHPLDMLMHRARYHVRRRRILRALSSEHRG